MKIVTTRRISQTFFFLMFAWFCVVATLGEQWWQLRGWPVNWFLQLDPLVAITTILTTHKLYAPLLWSLATIILTIILGRFFCGWICPLGSLHHFTGFLANRKKTIAQKIKLNQYHKAQRIKYYILIVFLGMACFPSLSATLQIGLLDPIPLITRSFNIALLPILDTPFAMLSVDGRFYLGAWLVFTIFLTTVLLNLLVPRFYCRFVCPLGALLGIINRFAIWRIGKKINECSNCKLCEKSCEGACDPPANIRTSECVLCFNCRQDCKDELVVYQTKPSAAGQKINPDISRRGFLISIGSGIFAVPAVRLSGQLTRNQTHEIIRPPGALDEEEFLKRCIKCGQCMRACPTNVIQPGSIQAGLENLWTPVLNNRIGTSGCQLNCVTCGQICPTSAIRPITLDEKLGTGEFTDTGPIKLGTAFVERNKCLPWAMDKPCIVCQEICPVSPKAIYTAEFFNTIRDGILTIKKITANTIETVEQNLIPTKFATGDYYCTSETGQRWKILANSENTITIDSEKHLNKKTMPNSKIELQIRLQKPYIDLDKCIGCGLCEHECPVPGRKAVRVSAQGQTRSKDKTLLLG